MSINERQIKLFGGVLADYCLFLSDSVEVPPHWETVRQTLRLAADGVKDSGCWQSSAGISCFSPDQASGSEMRWKRKRIPMPFGRTCANSRKMHHAVFLLAFAFTKEPMFMITSTAQLPRRATPLGKKVRSQWCQGWKASGFSVQFLEGAGDFLPSIR